MCISATNGKTTLTAMLAKMCQGASLTLAHNMAGANLRSGIATTLLTTRRDVDVSLLETDEAALPSVAVDVQPDVVVLANLFRDQLDRYGELEVLAERWRLMLDELDPATTIVYNADDPLIAELVDAHVQRARTAGEPVRTLSFGIDDPSVAAPTLPHAADSKFCRRCHTPLTYERSFVGHLGLYRCGNCGFERPEPDVRATRVKLNGLAASDIEIVTPGGVVEARLRIPGLYNVYNAVAATAAAHALGLGTETIGGGIDGFSPAFGRFERIPIPNAGTLTLLLVKNPTGLNEVVRTLIDAKVDLRATLFALNDGIADGRDTSWIWDADLEPLFGSAPSMVVTGDRAAEFALRAIYGGMDAERIHLDEDLEAAMYELLDRARTFAQGHAYALVTYTAMLAMRRIITERGWVSAYWQGSAPELEKEGIVP